MKNLRNAFLFAALLLVGCGKSSTGTHVWIDVPVNNLRLIDTGPIKIEGHAASPEGVSTVEVWVNGDLVESISTTASSTTMSAFETIFTPTSPGEYVIQVVAIGSDDTISTPDMAVVRIGESVVAVPVEDESTSTPTPVVTLTSTPTQVPTEVVDKPIEVPVPSVNYWADPTEIPAGGCTTFYWETTNVSRVEFGGMDQELSGSASDCMCEPQTYPLRVTYLDGAQETFRVTIDVTGTCATDTPVPDTTPPDPPVLLKPVNGTTITCSSGTILRWEAVSDPSGIDEYQVQVERHAGDNNWQTVSGSIFTGINNLEMTLSIECGWAYRWRVRAIDGEGNVGDWSGWFTFIDPLT
jgi:hypothetical protein